MNNKRSIIFLLITVAFLTGCAAGNAVKQKQVVMVTPKAEPNKVVYRNQLWDGEYGIQVECKSANTLGCRHKGRIYPWNAWLDVKGYDAKEYDMKEVVKNGNRATITIVKR